jgi:hypothetical protein
MLPTVCLNHELQLDAREIGDEWPDGYLPAEFESAEIPISKVMPQPALSVCCVSPKSSRIRVCLSDDRHRST